MKEERVEVLHYKNGLFHGVVSDARKQGEAICLYDAGAVLVGRFANDLISGQAVMLLSPESYFIGSFKKGMLDGPFVLRTPQYAIYARTNMNKIEGEIVVIERNDRMARVWEIERKYYFTKNHKEFAFERANTTNPQPNSENSEQYRPTPLLSQDSSSISCSTFPTASPFAPPARTG
jgi:hypothetical protein